MQSLRAACSCCQCTGPCPRHPPPPQPQPSPDAPATALHVSGATQEVLEQGPLTISVLDKPAAEQPSLVQYEQKKPAGKQQQVYPDLYTAPAKPASTDEGVSGGSKIVAAVGGVAWEILPASKTLKVRTGATISATSVCHVPAGTPLPRDSGMQHLPPPLL